MELTKIRQEVFPLTALRPNEMIEEGASASKLMVCARLRPIISEDYRRANVTKGAPEVCIYFKNDGQSVKVLQDQYTHKMYRVDHAIDTSAGQTDVYNIALKPIVSDVLKGYNGSALMYGPTASGKEEDV